ncbi:type II secretion system F family protein [Pengzhenrongella frigida]|uniref:Type II secretion system F family protein n=1 Tax=Pengzhenrongella frigida TaxID=1259133 RepID=A0A4Q5N4F8_9MICO|nr:type II secretion system F family protein [Cellulomonas sp. HLT2-17]RYV52223.1 type II secretion system F family protein [Cellulomonas sp. HLT2-17]
MITLLISLSAALLVVLGAVGLRLLRTTGLELLPEVGADSGDGTKRAGVSGAFIDGVGSRFQRLFLTLYGTGRLGNLDVRLRRAGRPEGLTVNSYVQRQAGFVVIGVVAAALFAIVRQPLLGILLLVAFVVWMDLWLHLVGKSRIAQIDRELPDFLDVLGVTVTAGLSFRQSVERVCEFHDGPLAQEMQTALREMSIGVTRREAFIGVRDRTRSESVGTFVTALLQAEELGVPLAQALRDIAAEVRRERAQEVRRQAAKAAPKVALVVTTTMLPGAIILMIAGLILANREVFQNVFG